MNVDFDSIVDCTKQSNQEYTRRPIFIPYITVAPSLVVKRSIGLLYTMICLHQCTGFVK